MPRSSLHKGLGNISSDRSTAAQTPATVTGLLQAIQRGDRSALAVLLPLVYAELRGLAHRQRRRWQGDLTLNTTALVHEAYLKLVDQKRIAADSRAHFFAVAAKAMRHILCNYARDRRRTKRGGNVEHVSLNEGHEAIGLQLSEQHADVLSSLDDALRRLEQIDLRQSEIVECRFFGGLSIEETAVALGISPATVKRRWTMARAWLYRDMHLQLAVVD